MKENRYHDDKNRDVVVGEMGGGSGRGDLLFLGGEEIQMGSRSPPPARWGSGTANPNGRRGAKSVTGIQVVPALSLVYQTGANPPTGACCSEKSGCHRDALCRSWVRQALPIFLVG